MRPTFEDCVLEINEKHGKGYPMILSGPAGRQTGTLHLSPASASLRACLIRLKSFATDEDFLHQFGNVLFQALFPPRLLSGLAQAQAERWVTARILRLKLSSSRRNWRPCPGSSCATRTAFRWPPARPSCATSHPDPPKPLQVRPPLRILVSIANPRDQAAAQQRARRRSASRALWLPSSRQGSVHLTISEQATGIGLLNDLRRGVHVWHFIGHGVFNPHSANGSLAFENESGDTDLIDAKRLRILLEQNSVRLAILNACETGRFTLDPLLGIAPALVRAGIPAVVAMQFALPDTSAVEFSSMFYRALADGYPVDACVSEGRKAVITRLGLGQPDWAIPVLYMRSADGHLFQQDAASPTEEPRHARSAEPQDCASAGRP